MDWNSTLIPFNGFRVKVSIQCCAFNLCVLDFSRAHQLFFCYWDVHFFMCVKFMNNGFPNCIQFRWKWTMAAYNLLVGHCLQPGDDTLCAERTYYFLICYSIISYFHCVIILQKMSPVASIRQFWFFVSFFFYSDEFYIFCGFSLKFNTEMGNFDGTQPLVCHIFVLNLHRFHILRVLQRVMISDMSFWLTFSSSTE